MKVCCQQSFASILNLQSFCFGGYLALVRILLSIKRFNVHNSVWFSDSSSWTNFDNRLAWWEWWWWGDRLARWKGWWWGDGLARWKGWWWRRDIMTWIEDKLWWFDSQKRVSTHFGFQWSLEVVNVSFEVIQAGYRLKWHWCYSSIFGYFEMFECWVNSLWTSRITYESTWRYGAHIICFWIITGC